MAKVVAPFTTQKQTGEETTIVNKYWFQNMACKQTMVLKKIIVIIIAVTIINNSKTVLRNITITESTHIYM